MLTGLALCVSAQASGCLFPSFDDVTPCTEGCDESCDLTAGMGGPAGVRIVPSSGAPTFCIDATEVSVGQYRSFYEGAAFPLSASFFPDQCDWKANEREAFRPLGIGTNGQGSDYIWPHFDDRKQENRPVMGIDWCDAAIFCHWAGKRLCGSEQPTNRHIDTTESSWSRTGEWFRACGGPEGRRFGYGSDTPIAGRCNQGEGGDPNPFNTTDVTEPSSCAAAWPDGPVYNMNGNVQEHEDNCTDGSTSTFATDTCYPRGGAYLLDLQYTSCAYAEIGSVYPRGKKTEFTGIRCCW
ncbi:Hypothetical protein A7982_01576 [Minicystis rosea]|nr:Hypothetical protein A7982_01576 [Minicystis rosea]